MIIKYEKALSYLIVLLTIISVNQWSIFPIGNTLISWLVYLLILVLFIKFNKLYNYKDSNLIYLRIYLFWIFICIIRGVFVADNYWDYKSLINNSFGLLVIYSIYSFRNLDLVYHILNVWYKISLPIFLLLFFFIDTVAYGYYLIPVSFLILFFPALPIYRKYLFLLIILFVIFIDVSARSNVLKFILPFILSFLYLFENKFKKLLFKFFFIFIFSLPIILFLFALSGNFNIFKMSDYIGNDYTKSKIVNGRITRESLVADTRTFLYLEVIYSAIKNKYIIFGRTPASGNDSKYFGDEVGRNLKTRKYIRYSNEVSILNIFTWTGIIGVILIFLIFFKAAKLAIFYSKNIYAIIIGIYTSFRWVFLWIEDFNRFDIMNLMLWLSVGLCYSTNFRNMSNKDVKFWVTNILSKNSNINLIHKI
jgi:hypothetical protein